MFSGGKGDAHALGTAAAPARETTYAPLQLTHVTLLQIVQVHREPLVRTAKRPERIFRDSISTNLHTRGWRRSFF